MTRFARTNKLQGRTAKVPEEATTWSELKSQLCQKQSDHQDLEEKEGKTDKFIKVNAVNNIKTSWCDFESTKKYIKKNSSEPKNDLQKGVAPLLNIRRQHIKFVDNDGEKDPSLDASKSKHQLDSEIEIDGCMSEYNHSSLIGHKKEYCKVKKKLKRIPHEKIEGSEVSRKKKKNNVEASHSKSADERVELTYSDKNAGESNRKFENYKAEKLSTDKWNSEKPGVSHGDKKRRNKICRDFQDYNQSLILEGREVKITKFEGFYLKETDAVRIKELRQKLIKEGRSKEDIDGVVRRHRRNAEKSLSKKKKKLCFSCRDGVHNLSECPKLNRENSFSSNVCYKCGSTEHSLSQCKYPGNDLKFANCFICHEVGHLSKHCPDNPRGLYPLGGGCRICGDVTHLKRDCTELFKKRKQRTVTVGVIGKSIESLDEDEKSKPIKTIPQKKINKIIKFNNNKIKF